MSPKSEGGAVYELLLRRMNRRRVLIGGGMLAVGSAVSCSRPVDLGSGFVPVTGSVTDDVILPAGFSSDILIRWGDRVSADAPPFDIANQSPEAQEKQFGYNNDFIAYMPLPRGSDNSDHGLLCVNHEYTDAHMMFPGFDDLWDASQKISKRQIHHPATRRPCLEDTRFQDQRPYGNRRRPRNDRER